MFEYGKIYSKINIKYIPKLGMNKYKVDKLLYLIKLYLYLFGYPDVAGHMRFRLINRNIVFKKDEKLLDAGCGIGIYIQEFSNRYKIKGYGIDISSLRILNNKKIDKFLKQSNIFYTQNLEKLNLGKVHFDKIICLEVLEHIENDYFALKNLYSYLKKNGRMVITVPLSRAKTNYVQKAPEKYGHVRKGYSHNELKSLIKKAGFSKVEIKPYFFIFSTIAVKIQHILYKKTPFYVNAFLSPILTLISFLDDFVTIHPRGYIVVLKK